MLASDAVAFAHNGKPAQMTVMRNSGHCWGRIDQDGNQYDVFVDEDYYDYPDEEAASAFIEAVTDPAKVYPRALSLSASESKAASKPRM